MHKIVVRRGIISSIYTDKLPFHKLGTVSVERASNVEFDPARQGWTVTLADDTELPGCWAKRADALAAEVEAVNARL